MKCKKSDCFNCPYPDCINDDIRPPYQLSDEQKKRHSELHRLTYQSRKDNGVCIACGIKPPEKGRVRCSECLKKNREIARRRSRENGAIPRSLFDGVYLCTSCGREPPEEGYKLCKTCHEKAKRSCEIARTYQKRNAHKEVNDAYWKLKKAKGKPQE